jgi:hypothetical protein
MASLMFVSPNQADHGGSGRQYTNLQMAQAIVCAAEELEVSGYKLMKDAGLYEQITRESNAIYTGPAVDKLPKVSRKAKRLIQYHLDVLSRS